MVYTLASFLNLPSGDGLIPEPARSWIMAGGLVALVLYGAVRVVLYLFGNDPPTSPAAKALLSGSLVWGLSVVFIIVLSVMVINFAN